jgi:anti-sigma regulatory factor (Ser/Thr protein kinase)
MLDSVFVIFCAGFNADYVDRLHERVKGYLAKCKIAGPNAYVMETVIDELVCNILEHSHAQWVEVEMHPEGDHLKMLIRDNGDEFDPLPAISAKGPESLDEVHGERSLGLYMVGQLAKSWQYKRVASAVNELDFIIELNKEAAIGGGSNGSH